MPISTNTSPSQRIAQRWRDFRLEIGSRLAKAFECMGLIFPMIRAKWTAQRELKSREPRRLEIGYEARKRQLLVALRQKVSGKRTKITTRADD
jgi:hypothetical protein